MYVSYAYLMEEYRGFYQVRDEFVVRDIGILGEPKVKVVNGEKYELYFICRTGDGRRYYLAVSRNRLLCPLRTEVEVEEKELVIAGRY